MRQKTVRPPCASVEGSDMKIVPTETACLGVGVRVAAGAKSQIVSEGNSPAAKRKSDSVTQSCCRSATSKRAVGAASWSESRMCFPGRSSEMIQAT